MPLMEVWMLVRPSMSNVVAFGPRIEAFTKSGVDTVVGYIVSALSGIAMKMSRETKLRNNQSGLGLECESFGVFPPRNLPTSMKT